MKNADILRMAKAMLTPAVVDESAEAPDEGDGEDSGGGSGGGGVGSLPDDGTVTLALTPEYTAAVTPTFALDDPSVLERLRGLLEFAVRMLYPKGLLSGEELPFPVYPIDEEDEFPLPDGLAAATACLAAWMLSGETKLQTAYESALDSYLATLEARMTPIVNRYR